MRVVIDIPKTLDFPPIKVIDLETFRKILGY